MRLSDHLCVAHTYTHTNTCDSQITCVLHTPTPTQTVKHNLSHNLSGTGKRQHTTESNRQLRMCSNGTQLRTFWRANQSKSQSHSHECLRSTS